MTFPGPKFLALISKTSAVLYSVCLPLAFLERLATWYLVDPIVDDSPARQQSLKAAILSR